MNRWLRKWRRANRRDAARGAAFDAAPLESRIMLSATPLGAVVDAADSPTVDSLAIETQAMEAPDAAARAGDSLDRGFSGRGADFRFQDSAAETPSAEQERSGQALRLELVFVDTGAADYQQLVDDLLANSDPARELEVYLLDDARDGVSQISEILAGYEDVSAVHLVTHGAAGQIKLGSDWLGLDSLAGRAGEIAAWNNALQDRADLLIYGCDLAASEEGRGLAEALGALCGCDVAASFDDTGHAELGGDWDLEFTVGAIETDVAFSINARESWSGKLAIINVTTTDDVVDAGDGVTSLREAILQVNSGSGGDTIALSAGTFRLTIGGTGENDGNVGDLDILKSVTITGAGPRSTIIDGNGLDRVFHLQNDTTVVTMTGLTITGGLAGMNAGGIFVDHASTLNLSDAALTNNDGAGGNGGAVHVHGTFNAERVLFFGNTADKGAAVYFHNADGGVLTNITVSGNTAVSDGGGIWTDTDITISNSTITLNSANEGGGVLANAATVTISNSIVANNSAVTTNDDVKGDFSSNGFNLIAVVGEAVGFGGDLTGASPILDVLANNGGPTDTHLPLMGSPVINAGTNFQAPASDARGLHRVDGKIDIGAVEVGAATLNKLYWVDQFNRTIERANLDGSNREVVLSGADGVISPTGLVIDAANGKIYWSEYTGSGAIRRSNLDGSGIETLYDGLGYPSGIAVDSVNSMLYWSENPLLFGTNRIRRAELAGGGPVENLVTSGTNDPIDLTLDLDAGKFYWSDGASGEIRRANLDGSGAEVFLSGLTKPSGLRLDPNARMLYWTSDGFTSNKIQRANLNGAVVVQDLVTNGLTSPIGIALDLVAQKIYWSDWSSDKIQQSNLDGSNVTDIVSSSLSLPIGVALGTAAANGNNAPLANAGGPYVVNEGEALSVTGAASSDPDGDPLSYAWDLDNDGIYGESGEPQSSAAVITWSELQTLGILNDGVYTIGLQVDDGRGGVNTTTVGLTVNNVAPSITSPAAASVNENATFVQKVTASDPVDAVTFRVSGGADQAAFTINSATGDLSFAVAPDFEAPLDAGGDNVYNVDVEADDGDGGLTTQSISVTVGNVTGAFSVDTFDDVVDGNTASIEDLVEMKGSDGAISLREAIIAANNTPGHDTINLPAGLFVLSLGGGGENFAAEGDLDVRDDLTIVGAGAGTTIIDGAGIDRVFEIRGGVVVGFSDITIRGGQAPDLGGGLYVFGSGSNVSLTRVIVMGNAAGSGGGIYNYSSTLTATDSTIDGNSASSWGGGVYNDRGTVDLGRVAVSNNSAARDGGGVYNFGSGASLTMTNATISGNAATSGDGGGLFSNQSVTAVNVTIANNSATGSGDGFFGSGGNGDLVLKNSILHNPAGGNSNKSLTSAGNNIDSDGSAGLGDPLDGADPLLNPLGNYGGPTATHSLQPGSPAINNGTPAGSPAVDQRGAARDGQPDIGAFELVGGNGPPAMTSPTNPSVNENQTDALALTAFDPESDPVAFAITGGADAAKFTISGSNQLAFLVAPDYEMPNDADLDNVYLVEITAADGAGGQDIQLISVMVAPINDNTPLAIGDSLTVAQGEQATVLDGGAASVLSNDMDADLPGDTLTAVLDTAPSFASSFTLNPDGAFSYTHNGTSNFGDSFSYRVSDGVNISGAIAVTINVTPPVALAEKAEFLVNSTVADTQETSGKGRGSAGAVSVAPTGDYVVVWTSLNQDGAGSYGVYGQRFDANGAAQGGEFRINETTANQQQWASVATDGQGNFVIVWTSENQDGSGSGVYARLYDSAGVARTGEFLVNVTTNSGQDAPVVAMDSDGDFVVVWEGFGTGDANGIFARGFDATGAPRTSEILVNNLTSGLQSEAAVAMDANGNFVVVWDDNAGFHGRRFDANGAPYAPQFVIDGGATAGNGDVAMDADGDFVAVWRETGPDGSGRAILGQRYDSLGTPLGAQFLVNTTSAADQTHPSIDSDAAGNFVVVWEGNGPGDSSGVFLQKFDAAGASVDAETPVNLTVANTQHMASVGVLGLENFVVVWTGEGLGDANGVFARQYAGNTPPTITVVSFNVDENVLAVGVVTVSDPDVPADVISWSITGGGADDAMFTINTSTGALSFLAAPDFEAPVDSDGDNVYEVEVRVSDGAAVQTQKILVATAPVNDNSPVITSSMTANVSENTLFVHNITAIDADLPAQSLTYSISGGVDAGAFILNAGSGSLSFAVAPDFESPTDFDADNVYEVEVTADDNAGNTSTQTLQVTVTPGNDNNPVFLTSNAPGIAENSLIVLALAASDADLPSQSVSFSIVGGVDGARFAVNASKQLTFLAPPDFESPTDSDSDNVYEVDVRADDGNGGVADQSIRVTVSPANDNNPIFTTSDSATISENTTDVHVLTATDADSPAQSVAYFVIGGADGGQFFINPSTQMLTLLASPDFESPTDSDSDNVYHVQVAASDGAGGTTIQDISVTVANANEAPAITSAATSVVAENSTFVIAVATTDVDGDTPSYSISGGADGGLFTINAATGDLTFTAAPDFESPLDADLDNVYLVLVAADDGLGGVATQNINVTVVNANEAPVITSAATAGVAENTAFVIAVTATDVDGGPPTYAVSGGADGGLFTINAATGDLSFAAAPNFEAPLDADLDNVYLIQVAANDGFGGVTTQDISVTVANANDLPVANANSYSVEKGKSLSVAAPGVLSGDFDEDSDTLTATLASGATHGAVVLHADGSFQYTPNPLFSGTDSFSYQVDDGQGGVAVAIVTIKVNIAAGPPPVAAAASEPPPSPEAAAAEALPAGAGATVAAVETEGPAPPRTRSLTPVGPAPGSAPAIEAPLPKKSAEDDRAFLYEPVVTLAPTVRNVLTVESVATAAAFVAPYDEGLLWEDLSELQQDLQNSADSPFFAAGKAASVTSALTVGYVLWTIRSGWLVTSLLAQMPAWRLVDPLVVLNYLDDESEADARDDDDSLESMLDRNEPPPEPGAADDVESELEELEDTPA